MWMYFFKTSFNPYDLIKPHLPYLSILTRMRTSAKTLPDHMESIDSIGDRIPGDNQAGA